MLATSGKNTNMLSLWILLDIWTPQILLEMFIEAIKALVCVRGTTSQLSILEFYPEQWCWKWGLEPPSMCEGPQSFKWWGNGWGQRCSLQDCNTKEGGRGAFTYFCFICAAADLRRSGTFTSRLGGDPECLQMNISKRFRFHGLPH